MVQLARQPRARRNAQTLHDEADKFWTGLSVVELAKVQGVSPVDDANELWGDFWPEDESLEAFVNALYEDRRQESR